MKNPEYSDPKTIDEMSTSENVHVPEFLLVNGDEYKNRFIARFLGFGWTKNEAEMEYDSHAEMFGKELLDPEVEADDCFQAYSS